MKFDLELDWPRLREASQTAGIVVLAGGMLHGILNDGMWYEAATAIVIGSLMILFSVLRRKNR